MSTEVTRTPAAAGCPSCGGEVGDPPSWPEAGSTATLHPADAKPRDHSCDDYFVYTTAGLCSGCGSLVLVYEPLGAVAERTRGEHP